MRHTVCVNNIGQKIVKLRGETSQRKLAKMAQIEQATLSRIENGEQELISPNAEKIARALKIDTLELISLKPIVSSAVGGRRIPVRSCTEVALWTKVGFRQEETTDNMLTDQDYSPRAYALKVEDDSMAPDIKPGMVVIIEPDLEPMPNDVVAVIYAIKDKLSVALRVYLDRGLSEGGEPRFSAAPRNSGYRTLESTDKDVRLSGVVVEQRLYRTPR